ncbi:AP2 ERF and B3 domain-containing transcription factor At1g50680 [Olea europaea subsp. europaea]|uniref:AP2 ERF and B3 domain-containing transcription factor At1g50680 n=1 Tax=Olea europaea subsp. europaea TaxID=158383 RepID=A0A8S0U9P9_OLEEU|nr:AP2 ERF and B3 domain-containing transcription factor At1g50680 [Olea europaea subsp. europaea]
MDIGLRFNMEEQSVISGGASTGAGEVSDCNNSISHLHNKYPKHDYAAACSKYKGVVIQQNGHWGAQIYANHQRIWLGTFRSEKEAAMAYDSAAIKLRNGDTQRNFPLSDVTIHEPNFQARAQVGHGLATSPNTTGFLGGQLFQKELTPSDVSKLNRLVIPKKYAVKYFPRISDLEDNNGGNTEEVELVFFDPSMRPWKFRYCYWKSSQSFVFTRGWNRFAKEKGLRPRDRIIFSAYGCRDGSNEVRKLCMIDVAYYDGAHVHGIQASNNGEDALNLQIAQPAEDLDHGEEAEEMNIQHNGEDENASGGERDFLGTFPTNTEKIGFRLFGVQIT